MFKLNSHNNKENKTLRSPNDYLSKDALENKLKEEKALLNQNSNVNPISHEENKVKYKNIKLKLRKKHPLSDKTQQHRNILEDKSNFEPQQPLTSRRNLKVNKSDLKLKSPLVQQSVVNKSKNKKYLKTENLNNVKSFDFFEGKINAFHGIKSNTTIEREAFKVFSFPKQQSVKTHNISVIMGSKENDKSVLDEKQNLGINSLFIKNNSPSKHLNKIETEKTFPDIENFNTAEVKIMTQYSLPQTLLTKTCLEETQFGSPILGDMVSAVVSDSNPTSPVLDSKKNKTSTFQTDLVKAEECLLSPILSENSASCKKEIQNLRRMKSLHNYMTNRKPKVLTKEDMMFSSPLLSSPVLDSSQRKKATLMQKFKTASCESYIERQLDEEFSPSPVLGASQFKKPLAKFQTLSVGENSIQNSPKSVILPDSYCVQNYGGAEFLKEIEHKGNNSNILLRNDSAVGSTNEACFIDQSNLNPQESASEPLSQVLGSNKGNNFRSERIKSMNSKLKCTQRPASLHIVSDPANDHPPNTIMLINAVSGLKDNDKLMESCSPVLDSSQFKKNYSEKQVGAQTLKYRESCSKTGIFSPSPELESYHHQSCSDALKDRLPSKKPLTSSISSCNLKNTIVDSLSSCSQPKIFYKSNNCFTDLTTLEQLAECQLPDDSIPKHQKRTHSPITDPKSKSKKPKTEPHKIEKEYIGPMLSLITESPVSYNGLCPNVSLTDQVEHVAPSFDSDLDIRKFPIMFPDLADRCSPNERSEKQQTDETCDIIMPSQTQAKDSKTGFGVKYSCQGSSKLKSPNENKLSLGNSKLTAEPSDNLPAHNREPPISPILSKSFTCKQLKVSTSSDKNYFQSVPTLEKRDTQITNQNQFTETNSIRSDFSRKEGTAKRTVKKNLALYYVENITVSHSVDRDISSVMHSATSDTKDNETFEDKGLAGCSQISGVEKLQTPPREYADKEKLLIVCENPKNINNILLIPRPLENDFSNHKNIDTVEPFMLNENVQVVNPSKNVSGQSKQQLSWINKPQMFDCTEEICIEDFEEESPLDKQNFEVTFETSKLDTVKRNLSDKFERNSLSTVIKKQTVPEIKHLLLNFEPNNQSKNTCEYMSSEESSCEVEIQDFSQRTIERSPGFRIEYSTTPTLKSSEGTQNEVSLNPPSFPPALDIKTNSPSEVLDSACKNRRKKVKRGSVVERLRRLVRAQRAEINMFHHEASSQVRARARACALSVTSLTQTCSLLTLNCRYVDAQRTASQEFGSGEELVDPEVHVYVDPSYTKNITAGCIITVFPPWHSVWHEVRGVVVMYCVTKLQLSATNHSLPVGGISLTSHPVRACNTQMEFNCQFRDDHCSCRSQLVGQLFTAPPKSQGPSQSAGGTDGAVTSALAGGWFPQSVKLVLTVLHCFQTRSRQNQVLPRLLCVDPSGNVCQLNFRSEIDVSKLGSLKDSLNKRFVIKKVTVCSRIFIDGCKGLRSFLAYLHSESTSQQVLYVVTPSSDDWSAQLIDETADVNTSADIHSRITPHQQQLLSLPVNEDIEGRARARVKVMAVRRDELFAWDPLLDAYFKLNITSSAVLPNFPARACLDLFYLWAHHGELTIDKFTEVTIVEAEEGDSPTIPPLAVDSTEGNLVLLDSVVTKVSTEAYLRWEGVCGHEVLRVRKTGMFYCLTCRQTWSCSTQKVVLEVCVAAVDIPHPIRVKVKSETARVLLADTSGQISSDKSYNMIGVIGSSLKCLAVVTEVLRNSLGDIIEFILEEL